MELLKQCSLCPRKCGINRYQNKGFCGANNKIKIGHYCLHMWEEPIISGTNGSGAIFFSNCNLKCIYCQNDCISLKGRGKYISNKKLGEIILELQNKKAHNINLVTPTHYVPQIASVIQKIKYNINIPIIYNTSSYENIGTIMMMRNLVDVYLADLKYYDDLLGVNYSNCDNYFEIATMAIDEMFRQVGKFRLNSNGMIERGLIVRVLVLPDHIDDAMKIIEYLYKTYRDDIFISIMSQYTPIKKLKYDNLNRKITIDEYNKVVNFALELGIVNAFIQDIESADDCYIPDFNY